MSDDTVSSFLVAPGKYVLYNCDDIARTAKATQARQKELEQLMAKAGTDPGAQLIASATYGPDYASARGEMNELRAAAAEQEMQFRAGRRQSPTRGRATAAHRTEPLYGDAPDHDQRSVGKTDRDRRRAGAFRDQREIGDGLGRQRHAGDLARRSARS